MRQVFGIKLLQWMGLCGLTLLCSSFHPSRPVVSKDIEFEYNGFTWVEKTSARDVAEALIETFGDYDRFTISPDPTTKLAGISKIVIQDESVTTLSKSVSHNFQVEVAAANPPPPAPVVITPKPQPKPAPKPKTPENILSGLATWYRHGEDMGTASRSFPKGTKLHVVAVKSGKSVDVVVNDYGPSAGTGIDLDLNLPAFEALAPAGAGRIEIKYYKI